MKALKVLLQQVIIVMVPLATLSRATMLPEADYVEWEAMPASMTVKRREFSAATVGNRFLVFGGYSDDIVSSSEMLDSGSWKALPPMPTARDSSAAVAVGNNRAIVVGGFHSGSLHTTEMLDLELMQWTVLPPMPTPRWGLAAVTLGSQVMVMGGKNELGLVKTVEMYHVETKKWTQLPPMSRARTRCVAAVVKDKVFIFGGDGGDTTVEVYHTQTQAWTTLSPMPFSRMCGAAVAVGKHILLIGGWVDGKYLNNVDVFDTEMQTWSTLPYMKTRREYLVATMLDNQVIVAGGFNEEGILGTWERLVLLPSPPDIPPAPPSLGGQKTALQAWREEVVKTGANYLEEVHSTRQKIHQTFETEKEDLEKRLAIVKKKENGLIKRLEASKDEWIKSMYEQIDLAVTADEHHMIQGLMVSEGHVKSPMTSNIVADHFLFSLFQRLIHSHKERQGQPLESSEETVNEEVVVFGWSANNWFVLLLPLLSLQLLSLVNSIGTDRLASDGRTEERNQTDAALPPVLVCPITGRLMTDPVVAADGHTYERTAIEHLLDQVPQEQGAKSPVTGQVLSHRLVTPSISIRSLVRSYQAEKCGRKA